MNDNDFNEVVKRFKTKQTKLIKEASEFEHDKEMEILEYLKFWVKEAGLNHAKIEAQEIFTCCIRFFDKEALFLFKKWVNSSLELYFKQLNEGNPSVK